MTKTDTTATRTSSCCACSGLRWPSGFGPLSRSLSDRGHPGHLLGQARVSRLDHLPVSRQPWVLRLLGSQCCNDRADAHRVGIHDAGRARFEFGSRRHQAANPDGLPAVV